MKLDVVIICRGYANGEPCPFDGMFLESYDPNGDASYGLGSWTTDITQAKKFADVGDAWTEYTAVRTISGPRPDGKPNRPLTAFNIQIEPVSMANL